MRYVVKTKLWSFRGDAYILDENGEKVFFVGGPTFLGRQRTLQDLRGNEVARIVRKRLTFSPQYTIYAAGECIARVKQEFTWFRKRLTIDTAGADEYTIDGSFWGYEYIFNCGGRPVAAVSRNVMSLQRTYTVDIVDGQDDVSILAICIVLDDIICHEDV